VKSGGDLIADPFRVEELCLGVVDDSLVDEQGRSLEKVGN
jgi:hypothetical protein